MTLSWMFCWTFAKCWRPIRIYIQGQRGECSCRVYEMDPARVAGDPAQYMFQPGTVQTALDPHSEWRAEDHWDSRVLVGVIYQAYKYCMSLIFIGAEHPQIPLISLLEIKYAGICLNYHLLFDVRRIKMNRLNVAICCCQTERPFIARERAYHWESSMDQWMKQSL